MLSGDWGSRKEESSFVENRKGEVGWSRLGPRTQAQSTPWDVGWGTWMWLRPEVRETGGISSIPHHLASVQPHFLEPICATRPEISSLLRSKRPRTQPISKRDGRGNQAGAPDLRCTQILPLSFVQGWHFPPCFLLKQQKPGFCHRLKQGLKSQAISLWLVSFEGFLGEWC